MYLICFIRITQIWTFWRSFCQITMMVAFLDLNICYSVITLNPNNKITMMVAFLDLNICYSVITLNPPPPPSWQTSVKDNWMTCKRENEGKLFLFSAMRSLYWILFWFSFYTYGCKVQNRSVASFGQISLFIS